MEEGGGLGENDMADPGARRILSQVALGEVPPDIVIHDATVFNAHTGEFIPGQSIWIKDDLIAYVGKDPNPCQDARTHVIDAEGMTIVPGLIDGHTHLVSNRYGIEEFIKYAIPTGVTTIITELMETATISGREGVEYPAKGLKGQPIRFYYTLPPVCGLTPAEEIMALSHDEMIPFLRDPSCVGVGEIYWGNLFLKGIQGKRVQELVSIALEMGKVIQGHTAAAPEKKLQAYTDFGISSCHEPITGEEVLERLRLGYWVMIREGSIRQELPGVVEIFKRPIDFRKLILSTDGVDPEGFLKEGYLDGSLKRGLRMGIPPVLAYQMVTLNVAEHFRLDHLIGSLSPGKKADLVMIPSPNEYSPRLVICNGRTIFREGRSLVEPRKVFFPDSMFRTVNLSDHGLPSLPNRGKGRGMELVSRLVTKESLFDLENPEEMKGVLFVLVRDRLKAGEGFMGLLKGFGLQRGAYGTTTNWDSPALIVVGCDPLSMETALGRLKENGGGAVYAIGEGVVADFPAPICGLISQKPMEIVRDETNHLEQCLRENGVNWEKPMLTVDTLTTAAIPHFRITHRGYVRLKDRKVLPVEA